MGFFSWKTQDTNRSIANLFSSRKTFEVTMTDDKGNRYTEKNYEGYGKFDEKDYHQLMAEMNRPDECNGDENHDRSIGIDLYHGTGGIRSTDGTLQYLADEHGWWGKPLIEGKTPNELMYTDEWEHITVYEDNLIFPNLTEDSNHEWVNERPEDCEYQGYFYELFEKIWEY